MRPANLSLAVWSTGEGYSVTEREAGRAERIEFGRSMDRRRGQMGRAPSSAFVWVPTHLVISAHVSGDRVQTG